MFAKTRTILLAGAMSFVWAVPALSAVITAKPTVAPPTARIDVKGSQFTPYEIVDLYFDKQEIAEVQANKGGKFNEPKFIVPQGALPGLHTISGVGLKGGDSGQTPFTVRVDWPQLQFSSLRQGANPYENVLSASNVGGLSLASAFGGSGYAIGQPAIAGGIAYQSHVDSLDSYGALYAFDVDTSALLWVAPTGPVSTSVTPAIANGFAYVGDLNGIAYGFDAVTGALIWSRNVGESNHIFASPAVANNEVYFGACVDASGSGACFGPIETQSGAIYALDTATGAIQWQRNTAPGQVFSQSSPAVSGDSLYIGTDCGVLYKINALTGAVIWTVAMPPKGCGWDTPTPVVVGNTVYASPQGLRLYALNTADGSIRWSTPPYLYIGDSPAIINGRIYLEYLDNAYNNRLTALVASTGRQIWVTPPLSQPSSTSIMVANGVIYAGSTFNPGPLQAFDINTGNLLWSGALCGDYQHGSDPAVVNGFVYVGCQDGNLYGLTVADDGAKLHRTVRPGLSSPQPKPKR